MHLWAYFTDPILRAPTWGTFFMCIGSALMGVILFLQKRSLLGESLSHAAYPGIVLGVTGMALFFPQQEGWGFLAVLGAAFVSSLLGLVSVEWLERKKKVSADTALCAVLSFFFGIGIVAMSFLQSSFPAWQRHVQMLLFGQAATMQDIHIFVYALLSVVVVLFFSLAFRPLQAFLFDRQYAKSLGIRVKALERVIFLLLLLSLMIGIRSVGITLVSAMAVAPAVAARQYTESFRPMLWLAAIFGAISGLVGNFLSIALSQEGMSLPTGPMIVLSSFTIALLSLLFAPRRGWIARAYRIGAFRFRCVQENILKQMWKQGKLKEEGILYRVALWRLQNQGWVVKKGEGFELTLDGMRKAASVVRLHRLWELYLTQTLKVETHAVHHNAEEMEHILTPELEARLTAHLANPKRDPHQQPIPERF
ncbi:MAG: metal ABC transporter permease [Chlamydiia bacterium]|nr:metal ABC transporter permease [Chlamydiia bacterium]